MENNTNKRKVSEATAVADVFARVEGRVGRLTLCRPDALNALSHAMALTIEAALMQWQADDTISLVLIDAIGEKAFCSGGDITTLYEQGIAGDFESGRQFWRDEYRLNALIDSYPKPYVAIMDGIVMGGGVGISAHGSHRIVTERSKLALPECSIGLVPDIGATHLLSRSPGYIGEYLALTGERCNASDAIFAGFADYFMPVERLSEFKRTLVESGDINVIDKFSESPPTQSVLADKERQITEVFGSDTLGAVLNNLDKLADDWATSAAKKIAYSSPLSLQLSFDLVRASRNTPGLNEALHREYRFVSRVMESGDILEGIRATLIDRDRKPVWKYSSIEAIPQELIDLLKADVPGDSPVFKPLQG